MDKPVLIIKFLLICIIFISSAFLPACLLQNKNVTNELNLFDYGPITLDPAISGEISSHTYIMQIFSGLVYLDNDLKIKPDIAERWEINSDGRVYTFYLRKNIKFHNGRPVTSKDIKFSWERACNPATGSSTAQIYLNDIVGVIDVLSGKASEISGVKIIDDYTIQITIDAPKAYFLSKLAYPTTFIVDRENVSQSRDWWYKPNGTGPFKLIEWVPGQKLILGKNIHYYRQQPLLDRINFQILSGNPMDLYETGQIDITEVYPVYIDKARDPEGQLHNELIETPEFGLNYIGFNFQKPPFNDISIRKAFNLAIDKDKIISIISNNTERKAYGIIPPGMPGYNPNLKGYNYEPELARKFIAESSYREPSNLPPITLTIMGLGTYIPEIIGAVIYDWEKNLGVKVKVRQLETEIFLYYIREEVDNMFYTGWIADYPDPQNFLDILFKTDAYYNSGKYSNAVVDKMLEKAAIEQDQVKRMQLYQEIEQLIIDDAALIPLSHGVNQYLIKPYVKGYKLNGIGIPCFSEVYIEK